MTTTADIVRRLMRLPARGAILLAKLYQVTLSPIVGRQCRYLPTCSNYFIEAVERFGLLRGGAMGLWRICRCHPFAKGGYDPVPKREQAG
ncbi:MAG: membrane protein insertion efficiency factor YidD [Planctomycetota bacterium]